MLLFISLNALSIAFSVGKQNGHICETEQDAVLLKSRLVTLVKDFWRECGRCKISLFNKNLLLCVFHDQSWTGKRGEGLSEPSVILGEEIDPVCS